MRRGVRGFIGVIVAATAVAVGMPGVANAATTWTIQSVPLPSGATSGDLTGVSCSSSTNCEALVANDIPAAEGWNGSTWTAQTLPYNSYELSPQAVSCHTTMCMAVGDDDFGDGEGAYAALWNGTKWTYSRVINYTNSELSGISCSAPKSCMGVGSLFTGDENEPLDERWNGYRWKDVSISEPAGMTGSMSSVSCVSATDCVATGSVGPVGGLEMMAFRWDGMSWTEQALPTPAGVTDPAVTGVSCVSASNCTAVGDGGDATGSNLFADRWNGTAWTALSLPLPTGSSGGSLASVSCRSGGCTAVGLYVPPEQKGYKSRHALAEFFNGTRWSVQATAGPVYHKFLTAVSCVAARTCTAVGTTIINNEPSGDQPLAEQK